MPRPSPARDRILRLLLAGSAKNARSPASSTGPPASLYALSERTGIAFSWVHKVVHGLAAEGWVRMDGPLEVTDPAAVFTWWRAHRTEPRAHSFHVADPRTVASALQRDRSLPFAVTTYFAENAYQGHLFARRFDAYVRAGDLKRARAAVVDLGGQLGGTNFRLLTGDDALPDEAITIGRGSAKLPCAPLPQVILDLLTEGGSAREAAELLFQRAYPDAHTRLH